MATALVLLNLASAKVVRIQNGAVNPVGEGPLQVLCAGTGHEELVFLVVGGWSYPLCEQLVMKSADRVYILPAGAPAAGENFVLTVGAGVAAGEVTVLDNAISRFASLRTRAGVVIAPPPQTEELLEDGSGETPRAAVAATSRPQSASHALVPAGGAGAAPGNPTEAVIGSAVAAALYAGRAAVAAAPGVYAATTTAASAAYEALPQHVKETKASTVGNTTSSLIMGAAGLTKYALVAGAQTLGSGLMMASRAAATQLGPAAAVPTPISAEAHSRVDQARVVSHAAVTISSALVAGAVTVAGQLGTSVGAALMQSQYGVGVKEASSSEVGKAVRQVAASSLVAFGEVWDGLEQAAHIVGSGAGMATNQFVEARYGAEAGALSVRATAVAYDVGEAAMNMNRLGPGGMARAAAVATARDLVVRVGEDHTTALAVPAAAAPNPLAAMAMGGGAGQLMMLAPLLAASGAGVGQTAAAHDEALRALSGPRT